MIWSILLIAAIVILALAIRRASKGTPFEHNCPCTPHIDHLKHLEDSSPEYEKHKKENLW